MSGYDCKTLLRDKRVNLNIEQSRVLFIVFCFLFLVYDVTARSTFDKLGEWLSECETYATKQDVVKMLVGNKIDKVKIQSTNYRINSNSSTALLFETRHFEECLNFTSATVCFENV